MQKILFLAANPQDTDRLRLDEELREIDEGLRRAAHRDQFELRQKHAVRSRDVRRAMLDEAPQIVHFSGYKDSCKDINGSAAAGLVFEDEQGRSQTVSPASLASLIELFADPDEFEQPISCVVLNGCYSSEQAKAIAQHIPFVIGLAQTIDHPRRIAFAVGLYDALGAGRSVEFAFKFACSACDMAGDDSEPVTAPVLLKGTAKGTAMPALHQPAVSQPTVSQPTVSRTEPELSPELVSTIDWESSQATKLLRKTMLAVYPSRTDLAIFLDEELNRKLTEISDEGNLTNDVFNLIRTARAQDWIDSLYETFCECNCDNSKIMTLQQQLSALA